MRVLVTGPGGHIGRNVVAELRGRGHVVRALVHHRAAPDGCDEIVRGDVRDEADAARACAGVDAAIHLAAVISLSGDKHGRVSSTNIGGVHTIARAAREAGVRRFVHVSSVHAFDVDFDGSLGEDGPRAKDNAPRYNRTKRDGEGEVRAQVSLGLDAVIMNPSGVIGPNDHEPSRMGRLFLDLAHRRLPALVAGAFDWVDVRDVAKAVVTGLEHGRTGENYILSGHTATLRQLARLATDFTGVAPPPWSAPMSLARVGAPFVEVFGRLTHREPLYTTEALQALRARARFDHTRAARVLDFAPRPLADTVRDLHEDFARRGLLRARSAAA